MIRLAIGAAVFALAACGGASPAARTTSSPTPSSPRPSPSADALEGGDICTSVNGLPDPTCTPGSRNPDVTQATIKSTICVRGWATKVRPPVQKTELLKFKLMRAYQYYAGKKARVYELDHLIPISLGGGLLDVTNLWPETPNSPNPKDKVERAANAAVCSGKMTLADAQTQMAKNWKALAARLSVKPPAGKVAV